MKKIILNSIVYFYELAYTDVNEYGGGDTYTKFYKTDKLITKTMKKYWLNMKMMEK